VREEYDKRRGRRHELLRDTMGVAENASRYGGEKEREKEREWVYEIFSADARSTRKNRALSSESQCGRAGLRSRTRRADGHGMHGKEGSQRERCA